MGCGDADKRETNHGSSRGTLQAGLENEFRAKTLSQKDTVAHDCDPSLSRYQDIAQSERIGINIGRKCSTRLSRLKMAAVLRGSSDKRKEGTCSTPSTSKSTDVSLMKSVAAVQTSGAERGPSDPKQEK